jgi:hypothetical protein
MRTNSLKPLRTPMVDVFRTHHPIPRVISHDGGPFSFTADGWPPGMQTRSFLSYYATKFKTGEIGSTYYGTPTRASTDMNWCERTPPDVKAPMQLNGTS